MRLGPLAAILLAPPNYRRPVPVISGAHSLSKTPEPFLSPASGRWVSSKVESRTPRLGDAHFPGSRGSEHHPILRAILSARLRCVFAHPEAPRFLRARSLGVGGHYPDRVPPAGELLAL